MDQLDVGVTKCPANWILFLQMHWRSYLMCSTWHHRGKSHHQMLKSNFNCYAEYTGTQQRFNYNRGDYEDARQELQEVPLTANGSVQQMWDTIKDRFIGLRSDHVPTIQTGDRKWKSN